MQPVLVLPDDVLLVSFDLMRELENQICIVGRKDGETITIVNAFEGQKANDIFKLLTTIQEPRKEESK